ncbi:MAG: hypothetical protein LUO93_01745 [Methanomicrobiales archaeon]|nr:hypothetical protein [Methanomicrobiales archaeon]
MTQGKDGSWAVILVLLLFFMLPIGWLLVTYTAEPYHAVSGEPLRDAAQAAGITVVNATDTMWPVGGAVGGKTYTLSDESGNIYTVQTQAFDSAESRDAAVQLHNSQSIGRGKPVGKLIIIGNYLVYVQPYTSGILKKIAPELRKLQAA